jgi:hypothetical protein
VLPAPWYQGRIILTGDAAHAVTPHLAQGAGMVMEDALVLADELDKTAPYRRRSPLSWPGDYRECSSCSTRPVAGYICLNSCCATATGRQARSNAMARVDVVP